MNDSLYQKLKEESWRRKLTTAEETQLQEWLVAHPELEGERREDAALNRLFRDLPEILPASNFNAQVLQAIERDQAKSPSRTKKILPSWWAGWGWVSRPAMAGLIVCAVLVSFRQNQMASRTAIAQSVAQVSSVASLPPMEWLQDFETINRLNHTPPADDELLAALQ